MSRQAHYFSRPRVGRLGWVFFMALGVVLVVVLFSIKTRALEAKSHVKTLTHDLEQERASVRMIKAEIAHLRNPKRLRSLAKSHLDLDPTEAKHTLTLGQAENVLPKRDTKDVSSKGGGR